MSADRLSYLKLAETTELGLVSRFKLLDLIIKLPLIKIIRAKEAVLLAALVQSARHDQFKANQKPIVFKSNATLAAELGYARPETISRMLSRLFDAGLITMKDSPNYKRHSCRHSGATQIDGFGIDLRVLVARYSELSQHIKDVQLERQLHQAAVRTYRSTLRQWKCALACGQGRTEKFIHIQMSRCAKVMSIIGKSANATTIALERASAIVLRLKQRLYYLPIDNNDVLQPKKACTYAQKVTHIDNTNSYNSVCSSNDERCSPNGSQQNIQEAGQASFLAYEKNNSETSLLPNSQIAKQNIMVDIAVVLKAVPFVKDMLPESMSWGDFIQLSGVMAGICGVSQFAYKRAETLLSDAALAIALAITLQKYSDQKVQTPGAYFVGMLNKAETNELHLHKTIFALAHGGCQNPGVLSSSALGNSA